MGADKHTQMLAVSSKHCHTGASWLNISPALVSIFLNRSRLFIFIASTHIWALTSCPLGPWTLGPLCLPPLASFRSQNYTEVVLDLRLNWWDLLPQYSLYRESLNTQPPSTEFNLHFSFGFPLSMFTDTQLSWKRSEKFSEFPFPISYPFLCSYRNPLGANLPNQSCLKTFHPHFRWWGLELRSTVPVHCSEAPAPPSQSPPRPCPLPPSSKLATLLYCALSSH